MLLEVYINFFESFVLFFIKKLMFLSFPLLFFQQNANQSETRIGDDGFITVQWNCLWSLIYFFMKMFHLFVQENFLPAFSLPYNVSPFFLRDRSIWSIPKFPSTDILVWVFHISWHCALLIRHILAMLLVYADSLMGARCCKLVHSFSKKVVEFSLQMKSRPTFSSF